MSILEIGQTIHDTYQVERLLGEGAFAEVYRVKHRFMGRQAMKVLKMPGISVEEINALLVEPVLLSHMDHPNIIRVYDANVFDIAGAIYGYFTMEYVAGGNLESYWQSFGVQYVPLELTVELIMQACRGLSVAHGEAPPIIHRDIKPQNLLVGYDDRGLRLRVSDFGLAKRTNPLTMLASARGTLVFKAPETFDDPQADSCAGDVWALGCTLYLLLTDRLPYPNVISNGNKNRSAFANPHPPAGNINRAVDSHIENILSKALTYNPEDRYQTAPEMLRDLEAWQPSRNKGKGSDQKNKSGKEKSANSGCPVNDAAGLEFSIQALALSRQGGKLNQAADLMEEAFIRSPQLRKKYEHLVKLWRRGIIN